MSQGSCKATSSFHCSPYFRAYESNLFCSLVIPQLVISSLIQASWIFRLGLFSSMFEFICGKEGISVSSKATSEARAVLGRSFCSSLVKMWIPSWMPTRSCCLPCTWYKYSPLHMLMKTLQFPAIPTLPFFLLSACININFTIVTWTPGEDFFFPQNVNQQTWFTLPWVLSSHPQLLCWEPLPCAEAQCHRTAAVLCKQQL